MTKQNILCFEYIDNPEHRSNAKNSSRLSRFQISRNYNILGRPIQGGPRLLPKNMNPMMDYAVNVIRYAGGFIADLGLIHSIHLNELPNIWDDPKETYGSKDQPKVAVRIGYLAQGEYFTEQELPKQSWPQFADNGANAKYLVDQILMRMSVRSMTQTVLIGNEVDVALIGNPPYSMFQQFARSERILSMSGTSKQTAD